MNDIKVYGTVGGSETFHKYYTDLFELSQISMNTVTIHVRFS